MTTMEDRVYQLVLDGRDSPRNYAVEMAVCSFEMYVLPETVFETVCPGDGDPAPVSSDRGEEYVADAFDRTGDAVMPEVERLRDVLCDGSGSTGDVSWEDVLSDGDVVRAADRVGEVRGPATFLYDWRTGVGIRTPTDLEAVLAESGPCSGSGDFVSVVPVDVTY